MLEFKPDFSAIWLLITFSIITSGPESPELDMDSTVLDFSADFLFREHSYRTSDFWVGR